MNDQPTTKKTSFLTGLPNFFLSAAAREKEEEYKASLQKGLSRLKEGWKPGNWSIAAALLVRITDLSKDDAQEVWDFLSDNIDSLGKHEQYNALEALLYLGKHSRDFRPSTVTIEKLQSKMLNATRPEAQRAFPAQE